MNFYKTSVFFGFVFLGLSQSAFAERWVVFHAAAKPLDALQLKLNNIRLVFSQPTQMAPGTLSAIDVTPGLSVQEVLRKSQALYAEKDIPIELVEPVAGGGGGGLYPGWHVEWLDYPSLSEKYTGEGKVVAVLDTGIAETHPNLVGHLWVNAREIPGNGLDDDNNGVVDDIHGANFTDGKSDSKIKDLHGHGSHCSGIIAASPMLARFQNDLFRPQGIAQQAKIMTVRILGGASESILSDAARGVRYAVDQGAHILSNSWRVYAHWVWYGVDPLSVQMLRDSIKYASEKGVIFVAAAGNENISINPGVYEHPMYPLSFGLPNMVGVAASGKMLGTEPIFKADFSNWGNVFVQVAAPGVDIMSTVPVSASRSGWASYSGTSMAAPIVSGLLARGLSGGLTWKEAIDRLSQTAYEHTAWTDYVSSKGIIWPKRYLD